MARFDAAKPSSYPLDPTVNLVPELPLGTEDPLGHWALRFTGENAGSGRGWNDRAYVLTHGAGGAARRRRVRPARPERPAQNDHGCYRTAALSKQWRFDR